MGENIFKPRNPKIRTLLQKELFNTLIEVIEEWQCFNPDDESVELLKQKIQTYARLYNGKMNKDDPPENACDLASIFFFEREAELLIEILLFTVYGDRNCENKVDYYEEYLLKYNSHRKGKKS